MSEAPNSALADAIIDYVEKLVEYKIRYESVGEDGHHVSRGLERRACDEAERHLRDIIAAAEALLLRQRIKK